MHWEVKILSTAEEQAAGAKAFPTPIPANVMLFFANVAHPGVITMNGVNEPLRVYLLSELFSMLRVVTLYPGEIIEISPDTKHVVETSAGAPRGIDFYNLLKGQL